MKIILASGSPRRKELLNLIIPEFEVKVSEAEEILDDNIEPEEQATQLAHLKAKEVFEKTRGDRIVIGADTVVAKNSKIYGKPKSREHAKQIIKQLLEGDKTHNIITGLSIFIENKGKQEEYKTFDKVKVYLKNNIFHLKNLQKTIV